MKPYQARIVLLRARGKEHKDIAEAVGLGVPTVAKWLKHYPNVEDVERALVALERDTRVNLALTLDRCVEALSEDPTNNTLARNVKELALSMSKAPKAAAPKDHTKPTKAPPKSPKAPPFAQ